MKLKHNGKPYIFTHKADAIHYGDTLSGPELEEFGLRCLCQALDIRDNKYRLCNEDAKNMYDSDLIIQLDGRFLLGIIKYCEDLQSEAALVKLITGHPDEFKLHYPNAWKNFEESGGVATPVFFLPKFFCLDTNGEKNIAGGRYEVTFTPYEARSPWLPTNGPELTEYEMYKGYAKSWTSGDFSFILDYVKMEFRGISDLSFLQLTSKAALIARIKHQTQIYRDRGYQFSAELVRNRTTNDCGILFWRQEQRYAFVQLEFKDNRIYRSYTMAPDGEFEPWTEDDQIVQNHDRHLLPFIKRSQLEFFIQAAWDADNISAFDKKYTEERTKDTYQWLMAQYGETMRDDGYYDVAYQLLFKYKEGSNEVEFITLFPNLYGAECHVKILEVFPWNNGMEATIKALFSANDSEFEFCFFATDYFDRQPDYQPGATLNIDLAATCANIEKNKDNDFSGEPQYSASNKGYPDMATFQTNIAGPIRIITFFDNIVLNTSICINKDTKLTIPLFFNADFMPRKGDAIEGLLWLTGSIF